MTRNSSSPAQEHGMIKADSGDHQPTPQPNDNSPRRESTDDDMPIMTGRRLRNSTKERAENNVLHERRSVRDKGRETGAYSNSNHLSRQVSKPPPVKERKKPGPRAWAQKPIMKNDMVAKKAVIREIESFWGKGFIRAYIPKCHRPLVKRGKNGKRSSYRDHETNPEKWLPSILKAILMVAKLTNDKQWLKEAMEAVVRYRIKHTGNRKPQLVTTDFDVIEDMWVKHWDVDYSFEIRYKHLMVNRKDQEDTDEDIDHILGIGCEQSDSDGDNDSGSGDRDQDVGDEDEGNEDDEDPGHDRISGRYLQSNGCTKGPRLSPASVPRQQVKHQKSPKPLPAKGTKKKQAQPPQQHSVYGYGGPMPGYGPHMDPWGRPMPPYGSPDGYGGYGGYGGFGAYGGYGGYGGYGHSQYPIKHEGREGSQQPPHHGMYRPPRHSMTPGPTTPDQELGGPYGMLNHRSQMPPPGKNKRGYDGSEDNTSFGIGHLGMQGSLGPNQGSARPKVKRESPADDEVLMSFVDTARTVHNLGLEHDLDFDVDAEEAEDVDAEVRAAELELKLARLKAKQVALKKAKLN